VESEDDDADDIADNGGVKCTLFRRWVLWINCWLIETDEPGAGLIADLTWRW
jgi:hypothetical protein